MFFIFIDLSQLRKFLYSELFQSYSISYNMGTHALPDMYALGPVALGLLVYIRTYQAKHWCPCYN